MHKTLIALTILAACGASIAGGKYDGGHGATPTTTTPTGTTNNGGGGGGGGAGVGVGIAAAQSVAFGGGATATGGTSSALGGAGFGGTGVGGTGGSASGNGSGNRTEIAVGGAVYEAASAPAYAPAGSAPRTSCRLFVGLGGTSTGGSLSGGVPIGNDQVCLSGAQFEFMDKINAMAPNTFSSADYLRAACKVEGMSETAACKPEAQRATAVLEGRPAPVATSQTGRTLPAEYGG